MYQNSYKGKYQPINPKKWVDPSNITYRSSIELRYFKYFDQHRDVIKISSERVIIPYYDPVQNKQRRYFVDLLVTFKNLKGEIKSFLIEIKCMGEACEPQKPKRITEGYKHKVMTYITNQAKWQAADIWAKQRGWIFKVFTEKDI